MYHIIWRSIQLTIRLKQFCSEVCSNERVRWKGNVYLLNTIELKESGIDKKKYNKGKEIIREGTIKFNSKA